MIREVIEKIEDSNFVLGSKIPLEALKKQIKQLEDFFKINIKRFEVIKKIDDYDILFVIEYQDHNGDVKERFVKKEEKYNIKYNRGTEYYLESRPEFIVKEFADKLKKIKDTENAFCFLLSKDRP